jgi:predicted RNase H-like nuclease (RuvC/YqgF family)
MALMQVMQGGVQMGVVKPENIAEAIKLFAEANEFKEPERFVSAPEPQQGPSPEQIQQGMEQLQMQGQQIQELAQENEQLKAELQNKQAETMLKAQDGQVNAEIKSQELMLKQREIALKEQEMALKEQEARLKAEIEFYKAETDRLEASAPIEQANAENQNKASELAAVVTMIQQMGAPKKTIGRMVKTPDGYIMEKQEIPQGVSEQ